MRVTIRWGLVGVTGLAALLAAACGYLPPPASLHYDFRRGSEGWEAGFSDYPPGEEDFYKLESGVRALPANIGPSGTGYLLSGDNHSDDLFMFLKRHLTTADGIAPNATYRLTFTLLFASNAPSGCMGIGGAPGEGVTLKAGASPIEPQPVIGPHGGNYAMNVDKGNQQVGGPAGAVVGDIANGIPCDEALAKGDPYVSLTRQHTSEYAITSDAQGNLWLMIGTDSGFEGPTTLYYQRIMIDLAPQ